MSRPTPANYGPGSGGSTYNAYGAPGTYQNQPGLRELGDPRSQNIWNEPGWPGGPSARPARRAQNDNAVETGYSSAQMLNAFAKMLQQKYPQYTNHSHFLEKDLAKGIAGLGGGGAWIVDPKQIGDNPQFGRQTVAKELGQAVMGRMIPDKSTGDALMSLWGHPGQHMDYVDWTPQTIGKIMQGPKAIDVGGYRTFPVDAYGMGFAGALGETDPGIQQGTHSLLQGPALQYAQLRGMLPREYAPPTVPQRPAVNVNDFGRRGVQQPVPTAPAVLPAQVNNPKINAYARVGGVRYS